MTVKKTIKKKRVSSRTSLTQAERKALSEDFYKYLNKIDKLLDKNLGPQLKDDLKKLRSAISKQSPYLRRF